MKNVAVLTVAFNEEKLIKPCIRQFKYPHIKKDLFHFVMVSQRPWRGEYEPDNTAKIALACGADHVRVGKWEDQATQFNAGLDYLKEIGYEWAIICDADEFYTPNAIEILLHEIEWTQADALRAKHMKVYWKFPEYKITPRQEDNPIIAIKTDKKFKEKRQADVFSQDSTAELHHFSYVRSDEEMKKKIYSFEHSHEFNLDEWYERVWKKWPERNQNLHPVVPHQFAMAIHSPPPKPILKNFYAN